MQIVHHAKVKSVTLLKIYVYSNHLFYGTVAYSGGKRNQKHFMTTGLMKSTLLVKFGVILYYHIKMIIQPKK